MRRVRYSKTSSALRRSGSLTISSRGGAAAVEVDVGFGDGVGVAIVQAFAGVFFHVQAGDADALDGAGGAVPRRDVEVAVLRDGLVELRDLIALRVIGVEVVLPREDTAFCGFRS